MIVLGGSTDVTTYFALRLAADGTNATGLTITNMDLQYVRSGAAPVAKVDATALAATNSAHGDNQAIEIDATDQPGLYRVDWPDAAFAAGVREVILTVKESTCFTEHLRVTIDPLVVANSVTTGAITAAAIANGAIDAATFAADVDAEILSYIVDDATRIDASALNTASGTSIPAILADTGTDGVVLANDAITAAKIAVGAIAADAFAAGAIDAAAIATGAVDADALAADAANEIADALLDRSAGVETGLTPRQWFRLAASALFGKASGMGTTAAVFRDFGDTKDRLTATVDADGNRTAITRDAT